MQNSKLMYDYSLKRSTSVFQLLVSEDGDQTAGSNNLTPAIGLLLLQDGGQAPDIITTTHLSSSSSYHRMETRVYIGNTQISTLLLCFLYLFVDYDE